MRHFRSCKSLKDRPDEFLEAFQETSSHFLTTIVLYYIVRLSLTTRVVTSGSSKKTKGCTKWLKINFCIHIYCKYSRFINRSGVTRGPPRVLREIPFQTKILESENFKPMNQPIISYDNLSFIRSSVHVV